jgi:AcrR family transcriptional regulator
MVTELSRVQRRQKQTRERIFRVAMELFQKKGFEQTTVSEITEAADIGKGTFFTYFPTKEAIFRQPGEMAMEAMTIAAQEGLDKGKPLASTLKNVLTAFAEWHEANKVLTRQMSKSSFMLSTDDSSSNKGRLLSLLMQLITMGQNNGEFNKKLDPQDAATVLAGIYFTVIAAWAHSEGRSLRDMMESSMDMVLKGLLA